MGEKVQKCKTALYGHCYKAMQVVAFLVYLRFSFSVCLFERTPSWRKESGYPIVRDFASRPGLNIHFQANPRNIPIS